jgi:hypothetical protein
MSLVEEIRAKLLKYPDARYEIEDKRIRVLPTSENGFKVSLLEPGNNYYMVFFNGWHEDFTESERALDCFALGLSTQCRLLEYHRGDYAYKWVMEVKRPTGWVRQSVTALVFFPFWRRRKVRVLQNQLLREKDPS